MLQVYPNQMEQIEVTKIEKLKAYGKDEDGNILRLNKLNRTPRIKVGDIVLGHYLSEEEDPDNFYFEISHKK